MALALGVSSSGACPGPTCSSSAGSSLLTGWQGASLRAACLAPWRCRRAAPRRRRQQVQRGSARARGMITVWVLARGLPDSAGCAGAYQTAVAAYLLISLAMPAPHLQPLRAALLDPPAFDPEKLRVQYLPGGREAVLAAGRRYTLTHNDVTGSLQLSIGGRPVALCVAVGPCCLHVLARSLQLVLPI